MVVFMFEAATLASTGAKGTRTAGYLETRPYWYHDRNSGLRSTALVSDLDADGLNSGKTSVCPSAQRWQVGSTRNGMPQRPDFTAPCTSMKEMA